MFAATSYNVYRDVKPILSTEGLTKIAETKDSFYVDEIETSDTYYYAITANNQVGSSLLSNTVYVQVDLLRAGGTILVTINEMNNFSETKADTGFLDYPFTVPVILSSINHCSYCKKKKAKLTLFILPFHQLTNQ